MQPRSTRPRPGAEGPVYRRIQEALRAAIAKGAYRPGDRLPSENELAQRYATTRATVVHALQALRYEGLIESRRGAGTFVAAPPARVATGIDTASLAYFERDAFVRGIGVAYRVLAFARAAAPAAVREALGLAKGEPAWRLKRLRLLEGRPLAVEVRWMAALLGAQLDRRQLETEPIQEIFEKRLGLPIARIANAVRPALVPDDLAAPLGLARGRPVLVRAHTFLDARGAPLLWGETFYREEYQIQYSLTAAG